MNYRIGLSKKEFVSAIKLVKKVTSKKYPILSNICLENDDKDNIMLIGTDLNNTIVVKLKKAYSKDDSVLFRFVFNPADMLRIIKDYDDDITIEDFGDNDTIAISSSTTSRYVGEYASGNNYPIAPTYVESSSCIEMKVCTFKDITAKLVNGRECDVVYISPKNDLASIYYGTESTRMIMVKNNIWSGYKGVLGIPGKMFKTMSKALTCNDELVTISYMNDATVAIRSGNCYYFSVIPTSKFDLVDGVDDIVISIEADKGDIIEGINHLLPLMVHRRDRVDELDLIIRKVKQGEFENTEMLMSMDHGKNNMNFFTIHENINIIKDNMLELTVGGEYDIHQLHNILKAVSGDTVLVEVLSNENVGNILRIVSIIRGVSQQYLLVPFNRRIQYVL